MNLEGRRIVITGATSGLGNSLSLLLAKEGAKVAICARDKKKLAATKEVLSGEGATCLAMVADVGRRGDVQTLIDMTCKAWGGVDAVVNNAGFTHPLKGVTEVSDDDLDACFRNNVFSVFYMMKSVVPIMKSQRGGIIVNISSSCGRRGSRRLGAYCSSKFAVRGITESSAQELSDDNIRCVSVSPSGMNTPMRADLFGKQDAERQQEPGVVAKVVRDIIAGDLDVPTGADVLVWRGKISVMLPEKL